MRGSKRIRPDRGGKWELRVDAGRDPISGKRRQRSKLFSGSAREADRELAKMIVESSDVAPADATLNDLVGRWFEHAQTDLAQSTVDGYRWRIDKVIAPELGQTRLSKLTAEQLDRFYRALLVEKGHAPSTIRQTHAIIRRALNVGIRWGWVERNVASYASPPRDDRPEIVPPSVEQVAAVIHAAASHPEPNLGPFVRLAAATGARRGELCGLRWHRVNLERGLVTFAVSIVDNGLAEKSTKTRRQRTVAIDPGTCEILSVHREWAETFCAAAEVALDPKGYVFRPDPTEDRPWAPSRVTKLFRGLPGAETVRLHDLRHFHALVLLDRGEPLLSVSHRLGHSQTSTTGNLYAHLMEGADARAAGVIGGVLDA